ncbi:MAG: hypothetical protein JWR80_4933, partial [Bradyrhizobium sp.]|nr:hypothetical protein [Bradyrhizobium sp.]
IEINVSGPFARSKIAWKFATYQHALLHRVIALMDGAAVAWNNRCTLSAILSARALMETIAAISHFERAIGVLMKDEDLGGLDAYATRGSFASRNPEWLKEFPDTTAINAQTYVDKFDSRAPGFKGHYDILSERAHPNSLGHNFMFSKLDRAVGSVSYSDEREPERNAQMVLAGLIALPLVESMMDRLDALILQVSEMHHRLSPVPLA